jgi:hypothetical protein
LVTAKAARPRVGHKPALRGPMWTVITLACLAVAAILTGCGGSSATATATTPTAAATTVTASTAATAANPSPSSATFSGPDGVPVYQPSTVIDQLPGQLRIISADSVTKVGAYYASTLTGGGWVVVSKTVTPYGASFTVHANEQVVIVGVYPTTNGSGVLISTDSLNSLHGIPIYQPSAVLSQAAGSLRLISGDSVTRVGGYYASTFSGGGWVVVAKTVTPHSARFAVRKNGQGATVAVFPYGAGSAVLITG